MPRIELLVEGNVHKSVKGMLNWDLGIPLEIASLSQTQIEIPFGEAKWRQPAHRLILQCKNITGKITPINICILKGNHIVANSEKLNDNHYKELEDGRIEVTKNEERKYYGEIRLLEQAEFSEELSLVQKVTDMYEERLESKDEDREKLIGDFSKRIAKQRESFTNIIDEQSQTINKLLKDKIVDRVSSQMQVSEILSKAILDQMDQGALSSNEMKKSIREIKDALYGKGA